MENVFTPGSGKAFGRYQHGSTTVEYALLFIPFFALFYAIVSYGFVFMLLETFSSAAEGGARAAIAIDPSAYSGSDDYLNNGVIPEVRGQVARQLDWLPAGVKEHVLGEGNQNIDVTLSNNVLTVVVGYRDYEADPILPMLSLPFVGSVPKVPSRLISTATARL